MRLVQTIPATQRPMNNVVLDVVPTMGLLVVRQARGDDQRGPAVVIYATEIQQLIEALAQAQGVLAGGDPADPAG